MSDLRYYCAHCGKEMERDGSELFCRNQDCPDKFAGKWIERAEEDKLKIASVPGKPPIEVPKKCSFCGGQGQHRAMCEHAHLDLWDNPTGERKDDEPFKLDNEKFKVDASGESSCELSPGQERLRFFRTGASPVVVEDATGKWTIRQPDWTLRIDGFHRWPRWRIWLLRLLFGARVER